MSVCNYGDPACPCQDGDACHYEGENAMPPPTAFVLATALEAIRLVYKVPRPWIDGGVSWTEWDKCCKKLAEAEALIVRKLLDAKAGV